MLVDVRLEGSRWEPGGMLFVMMPDVWELVSGHCLDQLGLGYIETLIAPEMQHVVTACQMNQLHVDVVLVLDLS